MKETLGALLILLVVVALVTFMFYGFYLGRQRVAFLRSFIGKTVTIHALSGIVTALRDRRATVILTDGKSIEVDIELVIAQHPDVEKP